MADSPESRYSFNLTVGSEQTPLNLRAFTIFVSDSIHSLCPQVGMFTNDISGLTLESRLNIIGQNIMLSMYDGMHEASWPLTCTSYEMPKSDTMNGLAGALQLMFKHTAKFSSKEPKGWTDSSPADVFKDVISKANQDFNSFTKNTQKAPLVEISGTSECVSYPLILNPGYDAEKFIDEILLPLSTDGSPSGTPFCAYIDAENKAHFESLKNIIDKASSRSLVFGKQPDAETGSIALVTLQNFSQDYNKIVDFVDESFVFFNEKREITSQAYSLMVRKSKEDVTM